MYTAYEHYLSTLHDSGKYRRLRLLCQDANSGIIDFSTNDYLGLSRDKNSIEAAISAAERYGVGATGSRLLSGNSQICEDFEKTIAADKNTEASLIFNSGFSANLTALSSLLDAKILHAPPIVFFDKLNHASLYSAVFLSNAELRRYNHNNMEQLESMLEHAKNEARPKFIVTETLFGMDGDIAPLEFIAMLARKYDAFLYLDEAHATGLFGVNGYGLSTTLNLRDIPHVIMGTFSKAIGVSGGYIACSHSIKEFIVNKGGGFIYSTAPSPMVVGAAYQAWQSVRFLGEKRKKIHEMANVLRKMLENSGFNIGNSQTHIVPIILHAEEKALAAQKKLLDMGIVVSCIRPPTVPPGSARLRIALTANHSLADIENLGKSLNNLQITE
jgi:8-amino-7-oxononanoate synthase